MIFFKFVIKYVSVTMVILLGSLAIASCDVPPKKYVQPKKYAAILMDYKTGKVLYSRGENVKRYPASLTKIMTLYMVFDALDSGRITIDQKFKTSRRATQQSPTKLGLQVGETISVEDIILALVTKSANDVAVVIAEALGGTEANFAKQMTQKAKHIGMKNTVFRNASGLHNSRQITTVRDMAILGVRVIRDFPEYYKFFSTPKFKYKGKPFDNHNKLLGTYQGADGIKTGYIKASGFNLVVSVKRGDKRLIGVVFGGVSSARRDAHMKFLLDKGFRVYRHMATRPMDRDDIGKIGAQKSVSNVLENSIETVINIVSLKPQQPDFVTREPYGATQSESALQFLENTEISGTWGIQVGAYRNRDSAFQYANQVMGLIPTLQTAKIHIKHHQKRTQKRTNSIYQSQVIGLTESTAKSLCSTVLDTTTLSCVVINTVNN